MKKLFLALLLASASVAGVNAQRTIDKLDRGVVAVKVSGGVYVSWRIQSDEYYDVTYNLYRDGSLIQEGLNVSNYKDPSGTATSKYSVEAVKRGKKQPQSAAVAPWGNSYLEIKPKHDSSITSTLVPNDACCADVDGDGQVEILLKYDNQQEIAAGFPKAGNNGEYTIFECLKLDGTVLWWVNCGPNMGDFQNNEQNIVGYDWDLDGKAEAVMRLCEGAVVHMADGTTYTVGADGKNGSNWTNYRQPKTGGVEWFTYYGNEFLFYCEGATGKPYQVIDFPCRRLEPGETNLNSAWGDGYGHRSNKFFFGAPYLDGRKPSMFIGRGIYTRHKFVALDVDPATHKLTERWRWMNNSNGPWKGQGYHNYAVVDVDWDGRDEIVWGSMVIDDNGKGLSTTGLGHGDAQHHGDLDPYKWGQEGFFCNEDRPGNNFRDLTTSKIYYRFESGNDDGRSIAGNFSNEVPGAVASSSRDYGNAISLVAAKRTTYGTNGMAQNFRCYWDGDLQEETFNYVNGKNTEGAINKFGKGVIETLPGSMTNNDTKGTPCYMGDILGDWREEFIMRTAANNIRIYTTTTPTQWRNYSLWYDHQYRNGMVWEMCGYNQPPHVSYFLGEMEGITAAPPSLTMEGRTEIANGGTISNNGEDVITCETNDMTINIADGATPYIYIDNAPSLVSGSAPSECTTQNTKITYTYYEHKIQGGAFGGTTRVVKQGDGILTYPEKDMAYSGNTDVWAGTLNLNGSIANSPLWLNRHTTLNTPAKEITVKSYVADYGSTTNIGGDETCGTITATESMKLGFGSRLKLDVFSEGFKADAINTAKLIIEKKDWTYGPQYLQPVIEFNCHFNGTELTAGKYPLGKVAAVEGNLSDIKIEGIAKVKASLLLENGELYLNVEGVRGAAEVEWNGNLSNVWDVANTENFATHDPARAKEVFVEGDNVYLTDNAANKSIQIADGVEVKPAILVYEGTENFTIGGSGSIAAGSFVNDGKGSVTMGTMNTYTDGNYLQSGTTIVSSLSNSLQPAGNLGGVVTSGTKFTIENGAILKTTAAVKNGSPMKMVGNGVIDATGDFTQEGVISGDTLVKQGSGKLAMTANITAARVIVKQGSMDYSGSAYTKVTQLEGTSSISGLGFISTPLRVEKGAKATLTTVNRQTTSSTLTGNGQITVYCATEKGSNYYATRSPMQFNMTRFAGTLVPQATYSADGRFTFNTSNGSDSLTINIPSGITVQNSGKTLRIGKLTGTGDLGGFCTFSNGGASGTNTWNVGNADDFTFGGAVVADNFDKRGTGIMTVSKSWTTTGTVKVTEGELHTNSKISLGTGALTVAEGATLSGYTATVPSSAKTASVTNSSVTVNGTLYARSSLTGTMGYWNFGAKPLTFGATGVYDVAVTGCATATAAGCTPVLGDGSANSSITFKDGATIKVRLANYTPTATEEKADSMRIFYNFAKVSVGNVKLDLPELPKNYSWDTSKVKEGYLFVKYNKETGVKGVSSNDIVVVEVVDASGVEVANFTAEFSQVKPYFHTLSLPRGIYVLRIRSEKGNGGSMTLRK